MVLERKVMQSEILPILNLVYKQQLEQPLRCFLIEVSACSSDSLLAISQRVMSKVKLRHQN